MGGIPVNRRNFLVLGGSTAVLGVGVANAQPSRRPRSRRTGPRKFLIIGVAPDAVDYTDPSIPRDVTPEVISKGLARAQQRFAEQGDRADLCLIRLDGSAEAAVTKALVGSSYDCVIIGRGIREPAANLALFEIIVNAVIRYAPGTAIAFNSQPPDSPEAAQRVLSHFRD